MTCGDADDVGCLPRKDEPWSLNELRCRQMGMIVFKKATCSEQMCKQAGAAIDGTLCEAEGGGSVEAAPNKSARGMASEAYGGRPGVLNQGNVRLRAMSRKVGKVVRVW